MINLERTNTKGVIGCIFGGKSFEHEISLLSAKSIILNLKKIGYEVLPIWVDKNGLWYEVEWSGEESFNSNTKKEILFHDLIKKISIAFPVMHGPNGEDGLLPALFQSVDIPCVGCSFKSSSIAMDKVLTKRICDSINIPTAPYYVIRKTSRVDLSEIIKNLGFPLFVKPSNAGSSVGVTKCRTIRELEEGINEGFCFDNKLLIEKGIKGLELECGVLGNQDPVVSRVGRIILHKEFYDYESKYIDKEGASFEIPAIIDPNIEREIQEYAKKIFIEIDGSGLSRIDFFVSDEGEIFLNEINPLPGFTPISLYPKMWEVSGLSYADLLEELLAFANSRHESEQTLQISFDRYATV